MPQFRFKTLLIFIFISAFFIGSFCLSFRGTSIQYMDNYAQEQLDSKKKNMEEFLSEKTILEKDAREPNQHKIEAINLKVNNLKTELQNIEKGKLAADTFLKGSGVFKFIALIVVISSIMFGIVFYTVFFIMQKVIFSFSAKSNRAQELALEANDIQKELSGDFFTNLVKINFKYLDAYYLQTQLQSDKSFMLAAIAASLSMIVIIVGVIMMFFDTTEASQVTVAVGAFGEFISAVFFYLYNRTVLKMSQYHQKLVLTQNIGLALKIAQELPEEHRVKPQIELISNLVKDINSHLSLIEPKSIKP